MIQTEFKCCLYFFIYLRYWIGAGQKWWRMILFLRVFSSSKALKRIHCPHCFIKICREGRQNNHHKQKHILYKPMIPGNKTTNAFAWIIIILFFSFALWQRLTKQDSEPQQSAKVDIKPKQSSKAQIQIDTSFEHTFWKGSIIDQQFTGNPLDSDKMIY